MESSVLRSAILRALGARGAPGGYARPEVEGASRSEIDAVVDELRCDRYLEAAWIPQAFVDTPRLLVAVDSHREW